MFRQNTRVASWGGKKQILRRLLVFLKKERSVSQLRAGFAGLPQAEEPNVTTWRLVAKSGEGRDQSQAC